MENWECQTSTILVFVESEERNSSPESVEGYPRNRLTPLGSRDTLKAGLALLDLKQGDRVGWIYNVLHRRWTMVEPPPKVKGPFQVGPEASELWLHAARLKVKQPLEWLVETIVREATKEIEGAQAIVEAATREAHDEAKKAVKNMASEIVLSSDEGG